MANKNEFNIQENVHNLVNKFSKDNFIYEFIKAYGFTPTTIARLKKGTYNLSKNKDELLWKNKVFFKSIPEKDLHYSIDNIKNNKNLLKHNPRFIIVTNHKTLLSIDTKTSETLDISLNELEKNCEFFFPLIGKEKVKQRHESFADIKAAEKMAKLYDSIRKDNPSLNPRKIHALNVFFSRLLFCFFAEDTGIFEECLFTNSIASHTNESGKDLKAYLTRLFQSLDTNKKSSYPKFLQKFPYVNGSLFAEKFPIPCFSRYSRKLLLECGELNWSSINPDIFGSMIQTVVDPKQRGNMGMHYTSVTNIMKVIEPLFLNDLYEEFQNAISNPKKLEKLLKRLSNIKIFDPACGSGNFLIIAYKELRKLEMKIIERLQKISSQSSFKFYASKIFLNHFYGIEIDDFTHEISILSLWLAEHQMNVEFKDKFGRTRPSLPLKQGGNVFCGNATRLKWEKTCPKEHNSEIYVLGNPPYLGSANQSKSHKEDIEFVFHKFEKYKKLDYVSCWFKKVTDYISNSNTSAAFVSTNSIIQGDQVSLLWPYILSKNIEIGFCYNSFKWSNNAKQKAGVTCVIIGLRNHSNKQKFIYDANHTQKVSNITPYLTNKNTSLIVNRHSYPLCKKLPKMKRSNLKGLRILKNNEFFKIKKKSPWKIKKALGAKEFLYGINRYCIWKVSPSKNKEKQKIIKNLKSIIIPRVTSENREYIPFDFFSEKKSVILDSAQAIYNPELYVFGIISSKIHMTWVKAVAGRLETRIRYSSELCYNAFPFPDISEEQKESITTNVLNVVEEREKHPEKTIAELYDPNKMPKGLKKAHQGLDLAIERCYRSKPFKNDEERLEYLFKLYEEMTQKEDKENESV